MQKPIVMGTLGNFSHESYEDYYKNYQSNQMAKYHYKEESKEELNFLEKITKELNTNDPYELEEFSIRKLSEDIDKSADALIAAAVYGHTDIQALLGDIDDESANYLDSFEPISKKAIIYYQSTLRDKIKEHLINNVLKTNLKIESKSPIELPVQRGKITFCTFDKE